MPHDYPEFSPFTVPSAAAASPVAAEYHRAMINRDRMLGGLGGTAAGALLGHHLGGMPGAAVGGVLGGAGGTLAGHFSGTERYRGDEMRRARKVSDTERAQEHRKELINMHKKASTNTFDGVMLSAMANELAAIQQEKVAINLAPVTNFLGNVGSKIVGGAGSLAGKMGTTASSGFEKGLGRVTEAVGGADRLNKIVGGTALGVGALGAGYGAKKLFGGPKQQQTTVNVRR